MPAAHRILFAALALVLAASSFSCSRGPDPVEARALAKEAYIFAYPMLENYKTMYIQAIDTSSPGYQGPFNTFKHSTTLLGPEFTDVVRPNNDTIYSFAWLDLRAEPIVVTVPAITDRYYSFQLVDLYTHNFAYIGTRATGTEAGSYLIAGPSWSGDPSQPPPDIRQVFPTEGNFVFCLGRTAVDGEADLPNVLAIQEGYKVQSLSAYLGEAAPPAPPAIVLPTYNRVEADTPDFIKYLNFLLGQVDIHPSERQLIEKFGRIGIGPNRPFEASALDISVLHAMDEGIREAIDEIEKNVGNLGEKNSWSLTGKVFGTREVMQGQYLTRASAARFGLYGNDLEEAYYPTTSLDSAGGTLDGSGNRYVLRFTKDEMPPVDAFWSITMYNLPEQLMVANPIHRYSIGDRTRGLKIDKDGSLAIYLQPKSPGKAKESNWLPAPEGPFSLTLRMYLPRPSALDPLYAPPGVEKVD